MSCCFVFMFPPKKGTAAQGARRSWLNSTCSSELWVLFSWVILLLALNCCLLRFQLGAVPIALCARVRIPKSNPCLHSVGTCQSISYPPTDSATSKELARALVERLAACKAIAPAPPFPPPSEPGRWQNIVDAQHHGR